MKTLNKLVLGIITATSATSFAVPSLYNGHPDGAAIKNNSAANVLRDSQSESKAWVMPPATGSASMTDFYSTSNIGFCPSMQSLFAATNGLARRLESLVERYDEEQAAREKAEGDLTKAIAEKAELGASVSDSALVFLDDEIAIKQEIVDTLLEAIDSCDLNCREILDEYKLENEALKELKAERRDLGRENRELDRDLKLADAKIKAAKDILNNLGVAADQLESRITTLQTTISEMYANRGKLEGGFANIDYDTGWQSAVQKLSSSNPSIEFAKIPTRNARIQGNFIGASDEEAYLASLPAILDYNISGHKYTPWGERTIGDATTGMPELIAGSLRLSLIGACPLAVDGFFEDKRIKVKRDSDSNPVLGISATYEYPTTFKYKVEASYNLYRFYELIKKNGKRGGFFDTKSYSKVMETALDEDTFSIEWEEQEDVFTEAQKIQIKSELKQDLMNRVLKTMAEPRLSNPPSLPLDAPGVAPANGALILANGLSSSCGFSLYCKVGSWVFKGADAIWGRASSEQGFKQTWDRTATETWSSEKVGYRADTVNFARD